MLEYPELGMEAVWKIRVENFPAFVVVDDKGNDFFKARTPSKHSQLSTPFPPHFASGCLLLLRMALRRCATL